MNNLDDFFAANNTEEAEAEIETEVEVETTEEAIEAESVEPEIEAEAEVAEETAGPDTSKMVPLAALQSERDKARSQRDEVERLTRELEQYRAGQQTAPTPAQPIAQVEVPKSSIVQPDPYDDLDGYNRWLIEQTRESARMEIRVENFRQSYARAVEELGAENLREVEAWADARMAEDPKFEQQMLAQPDPAKWVIQEQKRSALFKSFEADPDAYVRQRAIELGLAEVPTEVVAEAQTTTPVVRKPIQSIVAAKSRDSAPVTSPEDIYAAVFKK